MPTIGGNTSGNIDVTTTIVNGGGGLGVSLLDYGAKCDVIVRYDGTIVSGSAVLTSPGASFTQADVGKTIAVDGVIRTIASVQSPTSLTLSSTMAFSVAGTCPFAYGTDDHAAITAAFAALPDSGGTILVPGLTFTSTAHHEPENTQGVMLKGTGGLANPSSIRGGKMADGTYVVPPSGIIYTGSGSGGWLSAKNSIGFQCEDLALLYADPTFTGDLVAVTSDTATATGNPSLWASFTRCTLAGFNYANAIINSANSCLNLTSTVWCDINHCTIAGAQYPLIGVDPNAVTKGWGGFSNAINMFGGAITDAAVACVLNPEESWGFFGVTFEPPASPVANGILSLIPAKNIMFSECGFWDAITAGGAWATILGKGWTFQNCRFENTGANVIDIDCSTGDVDGLVVQGCYFKDGTGTQCIKPPAGGSGHTLKLALLANVYDGPTNPAATLGANGAVTFLALNA